ncbi:lycopene cyclase domain-containing protein [Oerskovia jenensis]|uniref:Lycopene cyclase domain-containing protein n=1 Tax=Oerskovia jenensis TaxID=162169 RepID=A0ABS2LEC6_9CELL|nr:lycopene cyclase domain-containing protein [Oerskovia jenensis]MBM7478785.1 lycopene cyclase domain-containing protein [Oerskovia jenensis]
MTNIVLNLVVLALVAAVTAWTLRRHRAGPLWWTAAVMVVLTLVFDTIMIAVGLYAYAPDKILGIYLAGAPLEDFAYPLAAVMLLPAVWTWVGDGRRRRHAGGQS